MAVDTKPNLSSSKFEQCVGDSLNLSGTTNVYGSFNVENGATISILSNYGAGKVLTSNSGGTATWENVTIPINIPAESIVREITQISHPFVVNDVVGFSGGTYNKPIANGTYDGEILGVVIKCINANTFELAQVGYVTGLTTLSASTTYFLSDSVAGQLTPIKPIIDGYIVKSVLIADSTTSGWVLPYPSYIFSTGSTAITGGINGLGINGTNICLGGNLLNNTYINLAGSNLLITGDTTFGLDIRPAEVSLGNYNSTVSNYVYVGSYYESLQSGATYTTQFFQQNNSIRTGAFTNSTGNYTWMVTTPTEMCIRSTESAFAGIQYYDDYSINYTNRSLVDKGYVDSKISGTTLTNYTITGDSVTTGFTVTHNLNETYVTVQVIRNTSPFATVYTTVERPTSNTVFIGFDIPPTSGQEFKVLIR